jgi:muconolactone D-isomerase
MEFWVEFEINIPEGTPESEVKQRASAEAAASADPAHGGHLIRLWKPPVAPGERKAVGLYRADSQAQLDGLLGALPLSGRPPGRRGHLRDIPRRMNTATDAGKVAVITGACRGIGAGLAGGYRQGRYVVVGVAPSIPPSDEQDYLTNQG